MEVMMIQRFDNNFFIRKNFATKTGKIHCVYLHGLGESGLCFESLLLDLDLSDISQIALDLPNYGKNEWSDRTFSLDEYSTLVAEWIRDNLHGPVVLIGHSMGGVIGQLLVEKYTDLILGFVNIEGNISIGDCQYSGKAAAYTENEFLNNGFEVLKNHVFSLAQTDLAHRNYYISIHLSKAQQFYQNSKELVSESETNELAKRFAELSIPKIYIAGYPGGAANRSIQQLVEINAEHVILEPSGHWPFIDQYTVFKNNLRQFLDRLHSSN